VSIFWRSAFLLRRESGRDAGGACLQHRGDLRLHEAEAGDAEAGVAVVGRDGIGLLDAVDDVFAAGDVFDDPVAILFDNVGEDREDGGSGISQLDGAQTQHRKACGPDAFARFLRGEGTDPGLAGGNAAEAKGADGKAGDEGCLGEAQGCAIGLIRIVDQRDSRHGDDGAALVVEVNRD
jgi:hypothetical protein